MPVELLLPVWLSAFLGLVICALLVGYPVLIAKIIVLQAQLHHDHLTGLLNHKGFMSRLDFEILRARRLQTGLFVFFLDLDGFKAINDKIGHREGNAVLVKLARSLEAGTRTDEVVARLHGDEFAVIVVGVTEEEAFVAADRFRQIIEDAFRGDKYPVTASVGIGSPTKDTTAEDLLAEADKAMRTSKRHGRNRVTMLVPSQEGGPDGHLPTEH